MYLSSDLLEDLLVMLLLKRNPLRSSSGAQPDQQQLMFA